MIISEARLLYLFLEVVDLRAASPAFDWARYFADTGAPSFQQLDLRVPAFAREVSAILARERAIVASERARTVIARNPFSPASAAMLDVDRLIELTDRAAAGMMRSIVLMEQRLASPLGRGQRAGTPHGSAISDEPKMGRR